MEEKLERNGRNENPAIDIVGEIEEQTGRNH
jgi:hypothetical protein